MRSVFIGTLLTFLFALPAVGQHSEWFTDIAACSSSNVWLVGNQQDSGGSHETLIKHFDGNTWTDQSIPHQVGSLESIDCVSPTDVWAVGFSSNQTLVDRFNGSGWSASTANNPGTAFNGLLAVSAASPNNIWVVGTSKDTGSAIQKNLIELWNGTNWHIFTSPSAPGISNVLLGVAAVAADNVWAVGEQYGSTGTFPLALHWDGSSWTTSQTPAVNNIASLSRVKVVTATDIWAVGTNNNKVLAEHWDGSSWKVEAMQDPLGVTQAWLNGISVLSANNIWAVGQMDFSSKSLIEHYDGHSWTIQSSPNPRPAASGLSGVVAISNSNIWAVGNQVVSQGPGIILHSDGTAWGAYQFRASSPEDDALNRMREDHDFLLMSSAAQPASPANAALATPRRVRSFMSSVDRNGNQHNATADIHANGVITCTSASSSDIHNPGKCYVATSGAGAYQLSPRQTMGTGPGGTMTLICNGTAPMVCWVSIVD